MPARARVSALGALQGIVMTLDNRSKRPTVELLEAVREMANDAIAVLQEPDPVKQKVGFILLAIQQSTEVRVVTKDRKRVTRVTILDHTIYNWALEEIHALAGVQP